MLFSGWKLSVSIPFGLRGWQDRVSDNHWTIELAKKKESSSDAVLQQMPGFSHERVALRHALARTLADQKIMGVEMSKRTGITASLLSRYTKNRQDIMTGNLDIILSGLTTTEFRYFLSVLLEGEHILEEIERVLLDPEIQTESRTAAFNAWFTAYIDQECSSSDIVDLIVLLGERLQAKMQSATDDEMDMD